MRRFVLLVILPHVLLACGTSHSDGSAMQESGGAPPMPPTDYLPVTPSASAEMPNVPAATDAGSVTFEWPEATADSGKRCIAGRYTGTFECLYVATSGGAMVPVNGAISLVLLQSTDGEFLEVQNGRLEGSANLIFAFGADIVGRLDCNTLRFEGSLMQGAYSGLLLINGNFDGPLQSDYDPSGPALINGSWELHEQGATSNGTCAGTWSATWAP